MGCEFFHSVCSLVSSLVTFTPCDLLAWQHEMRRQNGTFQSYFELLIMSDAAIGARLRCSLI